LKVLIKLFLIFNYHCNTSGSLAKCSQSYPNVIQINPVDWIYVMHQKVLCEIKNRLFKSFYYIFRKSLEEDSVPLACKDVSIKPIYNYAKRKAGRHEAVTR